MAHAPMVWPMTALALLTLVMLLLTGRRRFGAARAGRVRARDFRLGETDQVPADVAVANRNYMNLLEFPQLFYVLGLLAIAERRTDGLLIALAWAFVALRAAHSAIHISSNNVRHRFNLFLASVVLLVAMWVYYLVRL